ncbi:MAG: tetratricopeptide repeat protein [Sphingobacteriales bacterium]|nr:MAG: tetratricopeptide repeat protein [Sphingobacteriales bacterium]
MSDTTLFLKISIFPDIDNESFYLHLSMRLPFFSCFLVLLCCRTALFGQQEKTAAQRSVLQQPAERNTGSPIFAADTAGIDSLLNYANVLTMSQPDSAQELLVQVLDNSYRLQYSRGIAASLSNMGRISNIKGEHARSLAYYREARPYAEKGFKNKALLAMFYNCVSAPFYNLSRFDSMYYYTSKAEQLISNYQPKTLSDVLNMGGVYNNIGLLWAGVGNYEKTLYYLKRSLAINIAFPGNRDRLDLDAGTMYSNIGMIYIEQKDYDTAAVYLQKAVKLMPENAITCMGLGELAAEGGDPEAAETHFRAAIKIARQSQNYANVISSSTRLGILFFNQQQYSKAREILLEVVRYSRNQGNIDMENTGVAYRTLATIAAESGDYKQAYAWEHQGLQLLDSMKLKDKLLSLYALEAEIKAKENETSSAGQRLQLNQSRYRFNLLLIISVAGILLVLGSFWLIYSSVRNKQRRHKHELDNLKQEEAIKALQAMISGEEKERSRLAREIHDGIMVQFATIKMKLKSMPDIYPNANTDTFFHSDYYRQIVVQMEDATRDLRHTAHNLMPDMLLQSGLEHAINYFCATVTRNTTIAVEFQQVGQVHLLHKEFELHVYRIVQELLQNAIKHSQASRILVQLALLSETQFSLTVEDDGIGFDTALPSRGLGMYSIANRLQVLNGNMDVYSQKGKGTSISIEFEGNFKQHEQG